MTVKELQEELSKYPPDRRVVFYSPDWQMIIDVDKVSESRVDEEEVIELNDPM